MDLISNTTLPIGPTRLPTVQEAIASNAFDESRSYYCKRCRHCKPGLDYLGRTRPYRTCIDCRHRDTPLEVIPIDRMVNLNSLEEQYTGPGTVDTPFYCYLSIDSIMEIMSDEDMIDRIIEEVQKCDGYRYILKNVADPEQSNNLSFTAYCSRSQTYQNQISEELLRRVNVRMPTFTCGGRIKGTIRRKLGYVELMVAHQEHENVGVSVDEHGATIRTIERNLVPSDIRADIAENVL